MEANLRIAGIVLFLALFPVVKQVRAQTGEIHGQPIRKLGQIRAMNVVEVITERPPHEPLISGAAQHEPVSDRFLRISLRNSSN